MRRSDRLRTNLPPGFGVIWTTVALDLIGFGILFPVLARYAEEFGASPTTAGLLVASFSIAQLLFAPVWGRVSDRVGRRPVLLVSLVGTCIGSLLTGLATSLWLLFAARVIDGISGASVSVAQAAVADVAPPEQRTRLLGLLGAAFGLGFAAGPVIGGVAALVDHRAPFFVAAAIAAGNALVARRRLPETHPSRSTGAAVAPAGPQPDESDEAEPRATLATPRSPVLVRLGVVAFVSLVAFSGFEATFSLLVKERFGLSESGTYAVFAAIGIALVLVQAGVVGRVAASLGEPGAMRAGLACNGLGLLVLAADSGWAGLVAALALLVAGQGVLAPTLASTVARVARVEHRATALGLQQSVGGLARVAGPVLAGTLFEHAGVPAPYVAGGVLALLALAAVPTRVPPALPAVVTTR